MNSLGSNPFGSVSQDSRSNVLPGGCTETSGSRAKTEIKVRTPTLKEAASDVLRGKMVKPRVEMTGGPQNKSFSIWSIFS